MNPTVWTYAAYLLISLALTIWVARTLSRGGRRFLLDVFRQDAELARSVDHLLVVGFYLMNLGFVCFAMKLSRSVLGTQDAFELLSRKLGLVLVVLAAAHFLNLYVFSRMRRAALLEDTPPPVPPSGRLGTADGAGA